MFLANIALKNIRDRRMAIFWWSFSFFLLSLMMASIFPSLEKSAAELEAYMEALPDAFLKAFGIDATVGLATPAGFYNAELFSLMVPIMFIIFAVGFGSNAIAGEEEAGTLDLLLSNPLPRWRLVLDKFVAMVLATGIIALAAWLSFVVGILIFDIDLGIGALAAATANSALLGLTFGMFALAAGCATGRKGLATAVAIAITASSYLFNIMAKIVESLEPYEKLSLFYYHIDTNPLIKGLRLVDVAVPLAVIAVLFVVSVATFERRDLSG